MPVEQRERQAGEWESVNVLKHWLFKQLLVALRGTQGQRSYGLTQWGLSCVLRKKRVKTRCPVHRTELDITEVVLELFWGWAALVPLKSQESPSEKPPPIIAVVSN